MSAGSNPGADVVNFRFHITDINASLQSSSVVSVENDQTMPGGNKGAIVTEKTKIKIIKRKHKCNKCGSEDILLANDWCDSCDDENKKLKKKIEEMEEEKTDFGAEIMNDYDAHIDQYIDENKKLKEKMAKMKKKMAKMEKKMERMARIEEQMAEKMEEMEKCVLLEDGSGFEFRDEGFQHFWCAGSGHVEIWRVPTELMQLKDRAGDSRVTELFREGCFGEEWGNVEEFTYRELDLACLELTEKEHGMDYFVNGSDDCDS